MARKKSKRSKKSKPTSWLKRIFYVIGGLFAIFVLLIIIGLMVDEPGPGLARPLTGRSFESAMVITESDPLKGMARAFGHLETYACLELGGRVEVKDRGLVEKPDHDYYVFTVTCINGEEKFYFQIDNLSHAFKKTAGDGSSIENAIIPAVNPRLGPAEKHREGIRLEYVYLREFACRDKGGIQKTPDGQRLWIDQALLEDKEEFYDQMTVHCDNKTDEVYYFLTYLKGYSKFLEEQKGES